MPWPIIHLLNASPDQLNDSEVLGRCSAAYNYRKKDRAEAIEAALSVEGILDMVIMDLLVGRDKGKRDMFRELILFAEFCTSFQKWKILRKLMDEFPDYFHELSTAQKTALKTDLKDVIEARNKFAHGDLFLDVSDMTVKLRFYQDGGTNFLNVDDAFVNSLMDKAHGTSQTLSDLNQKFGSDIQVVVLEQKFEGRLKI